MFQIGPATFSWETVTPIEDLAAALTDGRLDFDILRGNQLYSSCAFGFDEYALAFLAVRFLAEQKGEDSYIEFWRLLGRHRTWQKAFEVAFGQTVSSFVDSFERWLLAQLPSFAQVKLQIVWPGRLSAGEFLYVDMEDVSWETTTPDERRASMQQGQASAQYIYTYDAGATGTASAMSIWWSNDGGHTKNLLGWYKDGGLTVQRSAATPISFTDESYDLGTWTLPGQPNTLPRLPGCRAGMLVNPGETCSYKGRTFYVDSAGRASIQFFSSENRIQYTGLLSTYWNFHASRNAGSRAWTIHVAE